MPNITPFTYRDGMTYLQRFEDLVNYIQRVLIPWVQTNYDGLEDAFTEEVNRLIETVNAAIQAEHDFVVTAIGDLDGKSVEVAIDEMIAYVDAAVESIINSTIEVSDPVIFGIISNPDTDSAKFLHTTYGGHIPIRADNIDSTGVIPSGVAVQAFINANAGKSMILPRGDVLNLDIPLEIPANTSIHGSGEFRFTAGIVGFGAIKLRSNCTLDGVRVTNPNLLGLPTGGRTEGVQAAGNDINVINCYVYGFQTGICGTSSGEFYNHRFIGNHVYANGAGGGASSSSSYGEDRGDGIGTWASLATITGNVVVAIPGTDARIGISVEGLPGSASVVGPHDNNGVTVSGNIIYGKFRRGVAVESVSYVTVANNFIADSTWWALAIISYTASNVVMTGNVIKWTRTPTDLQGSSWAPNRGPIMLYGGPKDCVISNNTVLIVGAASAGIHLQAEDYNGGSADNTVFTNNMFRTAIDTGTMTRGVQTVGAHTGLAPALTFVNNSFIGYTTNGMQITGNFGRDLIIDGNRFIPANVGSGTAIRVSGIYSNIINNHIENCYTAIEYVNATKGRISNNTIRNVTNCFSMSGSTNVHVFDNDLETYTTAFNGGTYYGSGNFGSLSGSIQWDAASIPSGSSLMVQDVSVPGAVLGDLVVASCTQPISGLSVSAYIYAPDLAAVVLTNLSGVAVNMTNTYYRVKVLTR
jgi:hypothetical protein